MTSRIRKRNRGRKLVITESYLNQKRLLAKLDYMQGSHTEAIEKQHKVNHTFYDS